MKTAHGIVGLPFIAALALVGCATHSPKTASEMHSARERGAFTGSAGGTNAMWSTDQTMQSRLPSSKSVAEAAPANQKVEIVKKMSDELSKVSDTSRTESGVMLKLKSEVLFDSGSATLRDAANNDLVKLSAILARYQDQQIRVEGHTDSKGSKKHNKELAKQRAQAVKAVLVKNGVAPERVSILGVGSLRPVSNNKTAEGRAQNRRVELHISSSMASAK